MIYMLRHTWRTLWTELNTPILTAILNFKNLKTTPKIAQYTTMVNQFLVKIFILVWLNFQICTTCFTDLQQVPDVRMRAGWNARFIETTSSTHPLKPWLVIGNRPDTAEIRANTVLFVLSAQEINHLHQRSVEAKQLGLVQVGKSTCIVLAKERHSKGERVPFSAWHKLLIQAADKLSLMFQIFLEKNYHTPWGLALILN